MSISIKQVCLFLIFVNQRDMYAYAGYTYTKSIEIRIRTVDLLELNCTQSLLPNTHCVNHAHILPLTYDDACVSLVQLSMYRPRSKMISYIVVSLPI